MDDVVAVTRVPTGRGVDSTLKARVGGLDPSTEYFYVWESSNHHSEIGVTRTQPAPGSSIPLRIGFSSCQHYSYGYFSAHANAAAEPLDIYVFLGDYIYERGHGADATHPRADPYNSNDLHSYRAKYALYRGDPGLRELHRVHPAVHIWDDHEVANNYSDNHPAPSPYQRTAGYRAAFEWLPRTAVRDDRYRVFKKFRLGQIADLFIIDERQYRTGDGDGQPRRIISDAEMQWLVEGLRASTATWKIIANEVVIAPMVYGHAKRLDAWSGYPDQRAFLLSQIEQAGIRNVLFISGDEHVYMVNKLASDASVFASDPNHVPAAIEYVGGSVTSPGTYRTEADVLAANPWTVEFDSTDHGYGHLQMDAGTLVTEYRRSDVTRPDGATTAFERFTQPSGTNAVSRQTLAPPGPPGPPPDQKT
jgi:phosphodiesterase/alkaline phosphatase D-like protein